jgi:glycine hydroxymethyltransferase
LRVGTPAITTRGLKEDKMPVIVNLIDKVIAAIDSETQDNVIAEVRSQVNKLMTPYPLFSTEFH